MVVRGDVMINANSVHLPNVYIGYSVLPNVSSYISIEWLLVGAEISSVENLTPSDIQSDDRLFGGEHVDNRDKSYLSLFLKIMHDICFHIITFTSFTYKLCNEIYI